MLITSRFFWCALVFVASFLVFWTKYKRFFTEKGHTIHKVMLGVYSLYLGTLFVLILFPTYMLRPFHFDASRMNLIPFRGIDRLRTDPLELLGNLLLFVPFGFFSVFNDTGKAGRRILNVALRAFVFSALMEFLQLFIGRVTDIDDVIINTLGALLGGTLSVVWHKSRLDHSQLGSKVMPQLPRRWRGKIAVPMLSIVMLICYGVGLLGVNAFITRDRSQIYTARVHGRATDFTLEAKNAALWDRAEQKMLFSHDADAPIYPAATMRLVLGLTVMDIADPDDQITAGKEILRTPMDCSIAGIRMGTTYTVRELLAAALIPSGADACYTLAKHCGQVLLGDPEAPVKDALEAFIAAANEKLQHIGAVHTRMCNLDGLDDANQQTTVNDLCLIAGAVLDDPLLSALCSAPEMEIGPDDDRITLKNTNMMLHTDSEFYAENFIGVKTGSTSRAGNCLIGAFRKNGKECITVVMHSGYNGKYVDTMTLAGLVH